MVETQKVPRSVGGTLSEPQRGTAERLEARQGFRDFEARGGGALVN